MSETAAETAARIFESKRLAESTPEAIAKACEEVGAVFADDDARARAAHALAEGIPEGVTIEAARRLVSLSLRDPAFGQYLKQEPQPGSFEFIKARYDAARSPEADAAEEPAAHAPRKTVEEVGAEIKARRPAVLYPKAAAKADEGGGG